jgi:hypothetical protein
VAAKIRARALDVVHEMIPPAHDTPATVVSWAVAAASVDVAAVVLHHLADVLPGATDEQRAFLTTTAREISPEIIAATNS